MLAFLSLGPSYTMKYVVNNQNDQFIRKIIEDVKAPLTIIS